ncbi:NLP/P60 family secreted protein [Streptantibioticus cattleyicolor NRRL 8057 = DSM 46488]|uniref:NLP/P60 family secreted protein n=1 Tax=Streptantibioticus cattleyicolor (strain ATCC 35852 / DSM 46488 / JCM 4925 / NBRC 14057 / NRRL 8057) TaxID=1003195 RepID=F8JZG3_STREN
MPSHRKPKQWLLNGAGSRLVARTAATLAMAGAATATAAAADGHAVPAPHHRAPEAVTAPDTAATTAAAQAVAYAYAQLGKAYRWGGTGPDGYDCSGLTQAAWRAAGVALPRTTYTQISAGTPVTRDRLRPGDLVFFHGVRHVGLYVGHGRMIHAPHPGSHVRLAPVDEHPLSGAVRPA